MDPILHTLRTRVLTANHSRLSPTWSCPRTVDPFARIYLIASGEASVRVGDTAMALTPGGLYLFPAHRPLGYHCPDKVEILWAHFTAEVLSGLDLFDYLDCRCHVRPHEPAHIRSLLARLVRIHGSGAPAETLESGGILRQLLAPFLHTTDPQRMAAHRQKLLRLGPVLAYVDAHLGEPLRVPDLARLVHLEPTHFSRVFARTLGVPPVRYVLQKRIERAMRRLWETDATLAALADELGFSDAFHLSKTFKRLTGFSPQEFRERETSCLP